MKNPLYRYKDYLFSFILLLFFSSCEKEVFVESNSNEANIPNIRFAINSQPPGAAIYLNGKNTGFFTPDTLNWMPEGNSQVTLKMENFLDTTFSISSLPGIVSKATINYYTNPKMLGTVNCASVPSGAKIYLDDVYTGKTTPSQFKGLIPKKYKFRYDLPEYRQDSIYTTVKSSRSNSISTALDDTLDIISYRGNNKELPSSAFYSCIEEDKDGNIWIGSMSGLTKFDGKKFQTFTTTNSSFMTSNFIFSIKIDKDKNLWVGTSNSILKFDGVNWTSFKSKMINCLYVGSDNTIFAATEGGGIKKIANSIVENITQANSGLQYDGVNAVLCDLNKNIWAGPYYNGVNVFDNQNWIFLNTSNGGAPYDNNCELFMNNNGAVYGVFFKNYPPADAPVATDIVKYDNYHWTKVYSTYDYICDREPFFDSKNRLLIGLGGIVRISPNNSVENIYTIINPKLRLFTYVDKLQYLYARKAFIDSKGNFWMLGGNYGVLKVKQGRWFN